MVHTNLTVIIPTLNAARNLDILLKSLAAQEHPVSETIIVDSGSTDQTLNIAEKYGTKIIPISPANFDHGATRNQAASIAKGEILIFMTQDAIPLDTHLTEKLIKPLADPDVALSYARQIASPQASLPEKFLRQHNYPNQSVVKNIGDIPEMGINTFFCSNACAAYSRHHFDLLGGFTHPVVCNEDMLFAYRAVSTGLKIAYAADALVEHTHNLSVAQTFNRYFDISVSLDYEPELRNIGAVSEKGLEFFKKELQDLSSKNKYLLIPRTLNLAAAKYLGYKAGQYHSRIPKRLRKYLGSNKLYWHKLVIEKILPTDNLTDRLKLNE